MGVPTPILPDYNSMGGASYPLAIDAGVAVNSRMGFAFAPSENTPPDLTVILQPGDIFAGPGALVHQGVQQTPILSAPGADPRLDLIVVDAFTGAVSVITGTEAPSPTLPLIPQGVRPVAQIAWQVGQTEIVNADLSDLRVPVTVGAGGYVLLDTQVIAPADPEIVFTGIDDTFDQYELRITALQMTAIGGGLWPYMQLSKDGGATFLDTGAPYTWTATGFANATDIKSNQVGDNQIKMVGAAAAASIQTAAPDVYNAVITLADFGFAGRTKTVKIKSFYSRGTNAAADVSTVGTLHGDTAAIDALRIFPSSSTFAAGRLALYGVKSAG